MTNTTTTNTAEFYELHLDHVDRDRAPIGAPTVYSFGEDDFADAAKMARVTGADLHIVTVNADTGVEIGRRIANVCGNAHF
jgi:hypothetical protein